MKEQESNYEDKFLNILTEYIGIEEYTTNVGIYFKNADDSLKEDGDIKIYNDETNELIHTFTKDEWSKYTKEKPYMYDEGIKHIRVETSEVNQSSVFEVCHKKELNVEKMVSEISKEDFDKITYIYTYLTGSVVIGEDTNSLDRIGKATYKGQESKIEVTAQPKTITNQATSENHKIVIKTVNDKIDCAKWINGEFLVKLPEDIIYAEINDITVNNSNITILGHDIYKEGNNYFIKIITENETEDVYEITIDADITPNPLGKKEYKYFQVYAHNANCNNYYKYEKDVYDVNKNSNIEENVGYDTTPIEIVPPTNLLTSESITNYDVEQNITVAPNIANVKKEQRTATINVYVKNEYTSTISDAIILGEIPYVGNEYIINKYNLNSEFTVEMQNSGLKVPEQLKNIVNVYYTENETATQDITLEDNGWTQTPPDWTKVRRYLIDFGTYKIPRNAEYTFMYDVKIPEGIEYDKAAYCNHAIFFCLDTIGGKLPTQTEPNRVGLRIARQYNLNITKHKKGTTQAVSGATYRLTEKKDEAIISTKMLTTNINGELKLNDLSINKTYTLKEIKAPENYELNEDEIEFKVIENAENKLEVQVLSEAKFKNEPVIETSETAREILKAEIEDSPKYKVIITKKEKDTNVKLKNVKFQISETEKDANEGKVIRTNNEGIITLDNLVLNKEYTLKEVQAEGYYLPENDYTFKLAVNAEGEYEIVSNIPNTLLSNIEDIPTLNIEIFNEKVPTYTLEILKVAVADDNNTGLAGAKYQLKSINTGNTETYITNNEGIIQINNLYEFVEGKNATGEYTLQEEKAPYGYANNAEKIIFVTNKTDEGYNITVSNQESLTSLKEVIKTETGIKLILQDRPLFKLTKIDEESKKAIPNVEFIIYSTTPGGKTVDYAQDPSGNYIGEQNENGDFVVKTNSNGEISLALPAGYFKAVEIKAPAEYVLPESEIERTHYFKTEGIKNDLEISSIEDLLDFSERVNAGESFEGKMVALTQTIDFMDPNSYENAADTEKYGDYNGDGIVESIMAELNNTTPNDRGIVPSGFRPIGTNKNQFKGSFEGNDCEIRNIYIYKEDGAALFGYSGGDISNLRLVKGEENTRETDIIGSDKMSTIHGGIVARGGSNSIINCYNSMNVKGYCVGGICGYGNNDVINCVNDGNMVATNDVAGICAHGGQVIGCVNNGSIIGTSTSGGYAAGIASNTGKVCNSTNNGKVEGWRAAGISGYGGSIEYCVNNGEIKAKDGAAGIHWSIGNVYNSINNGSVTSDNVAVGIAGEGCSNVENSCNAGYVTGEYVAGIGYTVTNITNCYNIGEIYGKNAAAGIATGAGASKVNNCYNKGNITGKNSAAGIATQYSASPYMENCYNNGTVTSQLGNAAGIYTSYTYQSGNNGPAQQIKNCYNTGNITGVDYVAGLANSSLSTTNSYNIGKIEGKNYVGGLVSSKIRSYSSLEKCFNGGNVVGENYVSGICANNGTDNNKASIWCKVYNVYNCGNVTGNTNVTGIADLILEEKSTYNTGKITGNTNVHQLYNVCLEANDSYIKGMYYLDNTLAESDKYGAIPKTETEMKSMEFTSLLNQGELVWQYNPNSYPTLNIQKDFKIEINIPKIEQKDTVTTQPLTEITVSNKIHQYNITTEIGLNSNNERLDGTITGEYKENTYPEIKNKKWVETVKHGDSNAKKIEIKPNGNYGIMKITINGEEINFIPDSEGNVTLDVGYFENVTQDIHIVVIFEEGLTKVIEHHYLKTATGEYTTISVADDVYYIGKVGNPYTTEPKFNIENLTLEKDAQGSFVTPQNAQGLFKTEVQEITYYYEPEGINLTIEHYYEGTQTKINLQGQTIETKIDLFDPVVEVENDKYEIVQYGSLDIDENEDYKNIIEDYELVSIRMNSKLKRRVNVQETIEFSNDTEVDYYYKLTDFKITTDVIEHEEKHINGTVDSNVKGGSISGEDENPYEKVGKAEQPQKEITITPDEGYEIVKIVIKNLKSDTEGTQVNLDELQVNPDGSITLPKEYIADSVNGMQDNKHIEVEFRAKTNVVIKHLEKGTEKVLYKTEDGKDYELISGYEGENFETGRKVIQNYKAALLEISENVKVGVTDDIKQNMSSYTNVETDENSYVNGKMYADTLTIIYWYERVPAGIIVKHIEVNEKEIKQGLTLTSGTLLDEEEIKGHAGLTGENLRKTYENTEDKKYKNLIFVNGPESADANIIIVSKDEDSKEAEYKENTVVEVRYYYERQYEVTTKVQLHKEVVNGTEVEEAGGTISKEGTGSISEATTYEIINSMGYNKKQIEIIPDKNYRVKEVTINGIKYEFIKENGKVVLKAGTEDSEEGAYFKEVQEDKHVVVEFERIPAKVTIEYRDAYTKELIDEEPIKVLNGYVADEYNETRPFIEGYVSAEPEPTNNKGQMTEEEIVVVYWYNKQFKITTDVIEHEEKDKFGTAINVKGGSISGEDEDTYEIVTRGESNTREIVIVPNLHYEVKQVKINGKVIDFVKEFTNTNNSIIIPAKYFENMQEDKHIEVEFKKKTAIVKVQHIDEETNEVIYRTLDGSEFETIVGIVNEQYKTSSKEIQYYELVQNKLPENAEGRMTLNETIVTYYYRKLPFNMKLEKEISEITVNGKNYEVVNNKSSKLKLKLLEKEKAEILVTYKITVTNTEKIAGNVVI